MITTAIVWFALATAPLVLGQWIQPPEHYADESRREINELGRLWYLTDALLTSQDTSGARRTLGLMNDVMAGLPDSTVVVVQYSYWGVDETQLDTAVVNIQWVKNGAARLLHDGTVDTAYVRALRDHLEALIVSLDEAGRLSFEKDNEPYAERIKTVLAREEFRQKENRNILSEALREFFSWLMEILRKLFGGAASQPRADVPPIDFTGFGKILVYIFYAMGIAALVWLVRWTIVYVRRRRRVTVQRNGSHAVQWLEPGETTDPDEHRQLADDWSSRGDYRRALRHLFLSIILGLDKAGVVQYRQPWTNSDFLDAIRQHENESVRGLFSNLQNLRMIFDRTWYGMEPASAEDFQAGLSVWQEVRQNPGRVAAR